MSVNIPFNDLVIFCLKASFAAVPAFVIWFLIALAMKLIAILAVFGR